MKKAEKRIGFVTNRLLRVLEVRSSSETSQQDEITTRVVSLEMVVWCLFLVYFYIYIYV